MVQIDKAFEIGNGIALDEELLIYYTFTDPTSGDGYEAPRGSFLVHKLASNEAKVWLKHGNSDTDWHDITMKGHRYKINEDETFTVSAGHQFEHSERFEVEGRLEIEGRFVIT